MTGRTGSSNRKRDGSGKTTSGRRSTGTRKRRPSKPGPKKVIAQHAGAVLDAGLTLGGKGARAATVGAGRRVRRRWRTSGVASKHGRDARVLGTGCAALLAAAVLWFGAGGAVLHALAALVRDVLGVGALLLPLLAAVQCWRHSRRRDEGPRPIAVGVGVVGVGVLGLAQLSVGPDHAVVRSLRSAGGYIGFLAAGLPVRVLPAVVLGLLLATAVLFGILVLAGTSLRDLAGTALRRQAGRDRSPAPPAASAETIAQIGWGSRARAARRTTPDEDEAPAAPAAPADVAAADAPRKGRQAEKATPEVTASAEYQAPELKILRPGRRGKDGADHTAALDRVFTQFRVDAKVVGRTRGAAVTRYEVELGPGVAVMKIDKLAENMALAVKCATVQVGGPIAGMSAIGIEIPNAERDLVTLRDVLRTVRAGAHPLTVGLGQSLDGGPVTPCLADMPHLLVGGATGSGKSVVINTLIVSVLARATPDQVRMVLIDPKRVELAGYAGVPHLLTPIITDPTQATEALAWVVKEMEARYEDLAAAGVKHVDAFNRLVANGQLDRDRFQHRPYLLVVIDELADLMMVSAKDVEGAIVRITQLARAAGIHLVVATQRPSVDVVTGLIKANMPSRLAFTVASGVDSRVIFDQVGAEKLVGKGDALFHPMGDAAATRLQAAYVDDDEVVGIVESCRSQGRPTFAASFVDGAPPDVDAELEQLVDEGTQQLLVEAAELVISTQLGSVSMLQRKLRIGSAPAARLIETLENAGVVGPGNGSTTREVLVPTEDLPAVLARLRDSGQAGSRGAA